MFACNGLKKTWQPAAVLNRQQPTEGPWTYNMDILGKIYQRTREHLKQEWNHSLSQQYLSTHSTVHCRDKDHWSHEVKGKRVPLTDCLCTGGWHEKCNLIIWPNGKNINDKKFICQKRVTWIQKLCVSSLFWATCQDLITWDLHMHCTLESTIPNFNSFFSTVSYQTEGTSNKSHHSSMLSTSAKDFNFQTIKSYM